jgi:hypothetical protein
MSNLRIIAESEQFTLDVICNNDKECLKHLKTLKKWQENLSNVEEITGSLHFCYRTRRYRRSVTKVKSCSNNLKIQILHL